MDLFLIEVAALNTKSPQDGVQCSRLQFLPDIRHNRELIAEEQSSVAALSTPRLEPHRLLPIFSILRMSSEPFTGSGAIIGHFCPFVKPI
jgi:hypothetical protein